MTPKKSPTVRENFVEIVNITKSKLEEHKSQWQNAFRNYAKEISSKISNYKKGGRTIKKRIEKFGIKEVQMYSSITLVKDSKRKVYYDLRFSGQHICSVDVSENTEPQIHFKGKDAEKNKEYLKIEKDFESNAVDICSEEAQKFFKDIADGKGKIKSREHKLESLALRELAVTTGSKKVDGFKFIQPIILGEGFFQMPTPLKGSTHKPIISIRKDGAASGGGIDILARVSTPKTKNNWSMAVVELKDENKSEEPVKKVMQQALIYATFIAYLLADEECGKDWYNIFRCPEVEKDEVPNTIDILVIAMMPPKEDGTIDSINEDTENLEIPLKIGGKNITLKPCTCYITHDEEMTKIEKTFGSYMKYKKTSN